VTKQRVYQIEKRAMKKLRTAILDSAA
jgi:DNA-directed RNA polymerase sigma subunit (sigma70/sigma32)